MAFDVTRPNRSLVEEDAEESLADDSITEVPTDYQEAYEIVEKGTECGGTKAGIVSI